jgi:hemerythrin-like domain-containing protein
MKMDFKHNDPIKRQVEVSAKDRGEELSPMSPPEAYEPPCSIKVDYEQLHPALKHFVDEHLELKNNLIEFESALTKLQKDTGTALGLNKDILNFIINFIHEFDSHNKKEEKYLFPLLAKRFLEVGEHSKAKIPITPIDVLEDEHTEASRLATEAHYIWTLVFKVADQSTQRLLFKDFLVKSLKLIEIIRLHIFREDEIVFSLAQKHLTPEELDLINLNLN